MDGLVLAVQKGLLPGGDDEEGRQKRVPGGWAQNRAMAPIATVQASAA